MQGFEQFLRQAYLFNNWKKAGYKTVCCQLLRQRLKLMSTIDYGQKHVAHPAHCHHQIITFFFVIQMLKVHQYETDRDTNLTTILTR